MDADRLLEDRVKKAELHVQTEDQTMTRYSFGEFVLHSDTGFLTRHGTDVPMQPQVLEVLKYLINNRTRIVSKDELVDALWDGRVVSDAVLNTRIRDVRRVLGDDGKAKRYLKTYPKRGIQFVAPTQELIEGHDAVPAPDRGALADTLPEHNAPRSRMRRSQIALSGLIFAVLVVVSVLLFAPNDPADIRLELPEQPSVAVLRFQTNDTGSRAILADGLAEDLIADLSQFNELFVISRNTSFTFDPSAADPRIVGRELGVRFVARGSLRTVEDGIRVTAELVDAQTGQVIWTEEFTRPANDLFAIQEEISDAISARLLPEMVNARVRDAREQTTDDLSAWDLFLQATAHQTVFSREGQERAISLARAALDRDPNLAAAYSLIAQAQGNLFFWSDDALQVLDEAIAAAQQALAMNPDDPMAYAALGYVYRFTGDEARAIGNLERAVLLNPNNATIRLQLAHTLDWFRHQSRALPEIELAIRLSPRDPLLQNMLFYKAHILFHLEEYHASLEASDAMGAVVSSGPWELFYHLMRAAALARLDRGVEAQAAIDAAIVLNPALSITTLRARFDRSQNHPQNRALWLAALEDAGLPD